MNETCRKRWCQCLSHCSTVLHVRSGSRHPPTQDEPFSLQVGFYVCTPPSSLFTVITSKTVNRIQSWVKVLKHGEWSDQQQLDFLPPNRRLDVASVSPFTAGRLCWRWHLKLSECVWGLLPQQLLQDLFNWGHFGSHQSGFSFTFLSTCWGRGLDIFHLFSAPFTGDFVHLPFRFNSVAADAVNWR